MGSIVWKQATPRVRWLEGSDVGPASLDWKEDAFAVVEMLLGSDNRPVNVIEWTQWCMAHPTRARVVIEEVGRLLDQFAAETGDSWEVIRREVERADAASDDERWQRQFEPEFVAPYDDESPF